MVSAAFAISNGDVIAVVDEATRRDTEAALVAADWKKPRRSRAEDEEDSSSSMGCC